MSLIVIRHDSDEGLSLFHAPLLERRLPWAYAGGGTLPDLAETAPGLIILGGARSANSTTPESLSELYLIERAIRLQIPILGICLGAQLTAKALGAEVSASPVAELGWGVISSTGEAASDPLFSNFQPREEVFQWHYEMFSIPDGAVGLAASEQCPNQAFRYGDRTWGMQFHLEVSPAQIASWLAADAASGDAREIQHPVDPVHNAFRLRHLAYSVFSSWLDVVQASAPR